MEWKRANENLQLMMLNRGFVFIKKVSDLYLLYANTENQPILVWCYNHDKLNIDGIKEFIHFLEKHQYFHGMVIYQNMITSSTKKVLDNLYKFTIELFRLKELQYDLTKLKYYCHHARLSDDESKSIKKKYGSSLPVILKSDIVCRYFFFQKGDILRITRKNGTIVFRVVK